MSQLNLTQVRIVDPVLTNVAQGYEQSGLVGGFLFPQVPVSQRGGNILTFGKEDFMLYQTARAPGENTRRVQYGYTGSPFALIDYSLEGLVPIENYQEGMASANGWSVDHMAMAIKKTLAIMALRLEYQQATIARTAATYQAANKVTLSGTAQFSDITSGVSSPVSVIEGGKEAVRAATGKRANTVVMGAAVFRWLKVHPLVVDRMKYTGRDIATPELLASLFDVDRVLVGDAIYSNDAGTAFFDVWGKDVVVAYTDIDTVADMGKPSYGYTYNLGGYPLVEVPYFDRNAKSWIAPVTRSEAPVIAAPNAGYLISNAVA
jgi:hypothetical protein